MNTLTLIITHCFSFYLLVDGYQTFSDGNGHYYFIHGGASHPKIVSIIT